MARSREEAERRAGPAAAEPRVATPEPLREREEHEEREERELREHEEREEREAEEHRVRPADLAAAEQPPEHADERTIRRIAEAQHGGISSEDSDELYERGLNPGGLHHRAVRTVSLAEIEEDVEEPEERLPRARGAERHMASLRRGM